jgi:hypothetical protein
MYRKVTADNCSGCHKCKKIKQKGSFDRGKVAAFMSAGSCTNDASKLIHCFAVRLKKYFGYFLASHSGYT